MPGSGTLVGAEAMTDDAGGVGDKGSCSCELVVEEGSDGAE